MKNETNNIHFLFLKKEIILVAPHTYPKKVIQWSRDIIEMEKPKHGLLVELCEARVSVYLPKRQMAGYGHHQSY